MINTKENIRYHQSLFGYKDGHRQLASSFALPRRDEFSLLSLSDNAIGSSLSKDDSYWTGFPLAESQLYAIMRTWPAPEMPRPGCVWTHAIFLDLQSIGAFQDLTILQPLFNRPSRPHQYGQYSEPLLAPMVKDRMLNDRAPLRLLTRGLQQVYGAEHAVLSSRNSQGEIDATVFAIWSQQWPRLRMAFSFQTARIRGRIERGEIQLALRVADDSYSTSLQLDKNHATWVEIAAHDAVEFTDSPLRKFLWRYGSDIKNPRIKFPQLVQIFQAVNVSTFDVATREFMIDEIFNSFPEPSDALILKRDLLGVSSPSESLVPSVPIADVLRILAEHDEFSAMVTPEIVTERLNSLSSHEFAQVINAVSHFVEAAPVYKEKLLDAIASRVTTEELANQLSPDFYFEILLRRPDLVDQTAIGLLRDEQILSILNRADDGGRGKFVRQALALNRPNLSDAMVEAFADDVLKAADSIWNEFSSDKLSPAVAHSLWRHRDTLLRNNALLSIKTTNGLSKIAQIFDYDDYSVLQAGSVPWSKAIDSALDNVSGDYRITFQAFLVAVAIKDPQPTISILLKYLFPTLREAIIRAELPYKAKQILNSHLPRLGWDNWDLNQRLTIAIGQVSQAAGLPRTFYETIKLPFGEEQVFIEAYESQRRRLW